MSYRYIDAAGEAVRVDCVRCAIEGMAGEATAARLVALAKRRAMTSAHSLLTVIDEMYVDLARGATPEAVGASLDSAGGPTTKED